MKKSAISVSERLRVLLGEFPNIGFHEAKKAVEASHGPQGKNSFSVTFYTIRKKMYGPLRKSVRKTRPTSERKVNGLRSAAELVRLSGGFESAIDAVRHVHSLQLS